MLATVQHAGYRCSILAMVQRTSYGVECCLQYISMIQHAGYMYSMLAQVQHAGYGKANWLLGQLWQRYYAGCRCSMLATIQQAGYGCNTLATVQHDRYSMLAMVQHAGYYIIRWPCKACWLQVQYTGYSCMIQLYDMQHCMIGQINNVICFFEKLDSTTKFKLVKAYCTSYYGCEM